MFGEIGTGIIICIAIAIGIATGTGNLDAGVTDRNP
jgi:hypothetical protein